ANSRGIPHPVSFPLKLAEDVIRTFSKPNDMVIDPFVGSGTTAIAAKRLGRNSIAFDIMPEYVRLARERLKAEGLRPLNRLKPELQHPRSLRLFLRAKRLTKLDMRLFFCILAKTLKLNRRYTPLSL